MKPKIVSLNDNGILTATYLQMQSHIEDVIVLRDLTSAYSLLLHHDNAEILFAFIREVWPGIGDLNK